MLSLLRIWQMSFFSLAPPFREQKKAGHLVDLVHCARPTRCLKKCSPHGGVARLEFWPESLRPACSQLSEYPLIDYNR